MTVSGRDKTVVFLATCSVAKEGAVDMSAKAEGDG